MLRITILSIACLLIYVSTSFAQELSAQDYIEVHKQMAIEKMLEHGCPASIILGIAMHESANGNSRIARHLNNHFGIKGRNNSQTIRSAYKGYDCVTESYTDFIEYLKRRKQTENLFEDYDHTQYEEWINAIARSGYAQSASWPTKVIATIRRHNLHEYDQQGDSTSVPILATTNIPSSTLYIVKKGDTLSAIAKKHYTTVSEIRKKNNLAHTRLSIGQKLVL